MKKYAIAFLIIVNVLFKANANCLVDTTLIYTFDYLSHVNKKLTGRVINTFDARNNALTKLTENSTLATNLWQSNYITTNQYDSNDSLIETINEDWDVPTNTRRKFSRG